MEHEENTAWSDYAVAILMREVKKYPALWDESHSDFTDVELRNSALRDVISAMEMLNIRTTAGDILATIESVARTNNIEMTRRMMSSEQWLRQPPSPWFTEAEFLRNARKGNFSQKKEAPPIHSGTTIDTQVGAREASGSLFSNSAQITVEPLPSGSGYQSHRKRLAEVEEEVDNSRIDNVTIRVLQPFSSEILERFNKIAPSLRKEVEYEITLVLNKYRILSGTHVGSRGSSATSTPVSTSPPEVNAPPAAFPELSNIYPNPFVDTSSFSAQTPWYFFPHFVQPAVMVPLETSGSDFFPSTRNCGTQTPPFFGSYGVTSRLGIFNFPDQDDNATVSSTSKATVQLVTPRSQFNSASTASVFSPIGIVADSLRRTMTVQPAKSWLRSYDLPNQDDIATSPLGCNTQTPSLFDSKRVMSHSEQPAVTVQHVILTPGLASSTESYGLSFGLRAPSRSGRVSQEHVEDDVAKDRRTS